MRREVGARANRPALGRFNSGPPHQRVRVNGGRPAGSLPAQLPTPRQKKPIPFRFPGLRKSQESCISIGSFFLSNTDPLCWALCLYETRNAVWRRAPAPS